MRRSDGAAGVGEGAAGEGFAAAGGAGSEEEEIERLRRVF